MARISMIGLRFGIIRLSVFFPTIIRTSNHCQANHTGVHMDTNVRAVCPHCKFNGHAPHDALGKRLRCKKCGNHFILAAEMPEAPTFEAGDLLPIDSEEESR